MENTTTNFGLTGHQDLYDYFLGRHKKKKRRNRPAIRLRKKRRHRNRMVTTDSQPDVISRPAPMPDPIPVVADSPPPVSMESPAPAPVENPAPVPAPVMADATPAGYAISEPAPVGADMDVQEEAPVEDDSMPSDQPAYSQEQYAYDDFLGLGKKARARIKENRAMRLERRNLKNDERRSSVERLRAETQMLQQIAPGAATAALPSPTTTATGTATIDDSDTPAPEPDESNPTKTIVIVVAGLIIVGAGIIVMTAKKKPQLGAPHLSS